MASQEDYDKLKAEYDRLTDFLQKAQEARAAETAALSARAAEHLATIATMTEAHVEEIAALKTAAGALKADQAAAMNRLVLSHQQDLAAKDQERAAALERQRLDVLVPLRQAEHARQLAELAAKQQAEIAAMR